MNIESTGKRIRYQRKCKGLTQAELAAKSNLSVMSIRRYESDNRIVPDPILKTIANALECNVRDLVPGARQTTPERLRELEKMTGKKEGYLDREKPTESSETERNLSRIRTCFEKMNMDGQAEAVKRTEELAQLKQYQKISSPSLSELWGFDKRQPPQEPPAAPSDGRDTATAENAATGPREAK